MVRALENVENRKRAKANAILAIDKGPDARGYRAVIQRSGRTHFC